MPLLKPAPSPQKKHKKNKGWEPGGQAAFRGGGATRRSEVTLQISPGKCGGGPPGPPGPGNLSPPGPGGPGKRPLPLPGGKPPRGPMPGGPALPSPDICPDCVPAEGGGEGTQERGVRTGHRFPIMHHCALLRPEHKATQTWARPRRGAKSKSHHMMLVLSIWLTFLVF